MIEYDIDVNAAIDNGTSVEDVEKQYKFCQTMNYLQMEGFIQVTHFDEDGEPRFEVVE